MARIPPVDPEAATGNARELLDAAQRQTGKTPNMLKTMAQSPAVLEGYLGLSGGLAKGRLRPRLRQQIALTLAEFNGCAYCLSAHMQAGRGLQISEAELEAARDGRSVGDPKADAALRFARTVAERRGRITEVDLELVRAAGYSDADIAEIVAHVAVNTFTNYMNLVADTEVDYPPVALREKATAGAR